MGTHDPVRHIVAVRAGAGARGDSGRRPTVSDVLRLEAREFTDATRWRWVLLSSAGTLLAEHEVRLDPESWQFEAFIDLHQYMWHAAPDRFAADAARIAATGRRLDRGGGPGGSRHWCARRGAVGRPGHGPRCGPAAAAVRPARPGARGRRAASAAGHHIRRYVPNDPGCLPRFLPLGDPLRRPGDPRGRPAPRARPVQPPRRQPLAEPPPRTGFPRAAHRWDRRGREGRRRPGPPVRRHPPATERRADRERGLGCHPPLRPRRTGRAAAGNLRRET